MPKSDPSENPRTIAVLDIGATALRMEIAEIQADGAVRTLDSLLQPVALGRDTFTRGELQRNTIEECVQALRKYRAVLHEYGITSMSSVRAVATSAVREARNRDRFLDRIRMATGLQVTCVEEAEMSRLVYLAARHVLTEAGFPRPWNMLVLDIGGGSTEVLLLRDGRVAFSNTYPLGSLRIRETLETDYVSPGRRRTLIEQSIERTLAQMRRALSGPVPTLLVMSGETRFAAPYLPNRPFSSSAARDSSAKPPLVRLRPADLGAFAERLIGLSPDKIVRAYRLPYPEAESVGPSLLSCFRMAQAFHADNILVPEAHLRTALELDLATGSIWTADFREQVEHAAMALAQKYQVDMRHARHTADLADRLFHALRDEHQLLSKHALILRISALLHEVGYFVNSRHHQKHSMYLILNSDLFGLTRGDVRLVALTARYHRGPPPQPTDAGYGDLDPDQRLVMQKIAALLRIACALDRGHEQRVEQTEFTRSPGTMHIRVRNREDLSLERLALKEKGIFFEDVYGLRLSLSSGPAPKGTESYV